MNRLSYQIQFEEDLQTISGVRSLREGPNIIVDRLPDATLRRVSAVMRFETEPREQIFMNGFQTWTYCPELARSEYTKRMGHFPQTLIDRFGLERYGDYYFVDYPEKPGVSHGVSYCYFRLDDRFRLLASLDERAGYTLFCYDSPTGTLRLERDCSGLHCFGEFHAFDLFYAEGTEKEVFDAWFEAMSIHPRTTERIAGYTSWYNRYEDITQDTIREDLKGCIGKLQPGDLFQIDDGWEPSVGDWLMPDVTKFPAGMKQAADEMLDYQGSGQSVMEMSHRSKVYDEIIKDAEKDLRELMNIPENYEVLFLQGGASQQFAMIPMNLKKNGVADYIVTGQWAKKAFAEAGKYLKANKIATSEDETFSYIPDCSDLPISEDADYVYICENNTIYGTKYKTLPNTKGKTLVADVSSCFLSEPVDVEKYGVIYGGVQKNVGPAGVVIVIIRKDLIPESVDDSVPTMLQYKTHADAKSLYNTPPCYGIYICGKVFKWLKKMGGLQAIKEKNEEKAKILYDFLDESNLFKGTVRKEDRSLMNVPFVTGNEELDAKFVKEATEAGFVNLKGHRTVGGMRASIYNAMPKEGVEKLVAFMKEFEAKNA